MFHKALSRVEWMLLIGLISLLIAIPLYSLTTLSSVDQSEQYDNNSSGTDNRSTAATEKSWATPTLLTRITSIILLFSAALSFNSLYVQAIGSGLGLYSGLFQVTTVTQGMEFFIYLIGALILLPWPVLYTNNSRDLAGVANVPEYPMIILFTTMGAAFLISSADLVSMYLSIELQSFAVYILAAIYRNSESATSAGLKYFLLGALSSALILLGSRLIYSYTGLTQFEDIYMFASTHLSNSSSALARETMSGSAFLRRGLLMIRVGFLFKVAAAPFHNWAPDVYDGVPTIVTTWLTVMPKLSIFIFLLHIADVSSPYETGMEMLTNMGIGLNVWKNLLLATSILSLLIGTVVGLAQYRMKRLLAYSTISHVGFLLMALAVNSEESMTRFLFYLIQYSITNLNAFFVVLAFGYIMYQKKYTKHLDFSLISQLKGQFADNPVLGLSMAMSLFSMAGIPPLIGFFAKYLVLYSAIENGYYFLALIGILASVISAAYYLRIIRVIHFENSVTPLFITNEVGKGNSKSEELTLSSVHCYIIAVLTLLVTLFVLSPSLILNSSNLLALSLYTA